MDGMPSSAAPNTSREPDANRYFQMQKTRFQAQGAGIDYFNRPNRGMRMYPRKIVLDLPGFTNLCSECRYGIFDGRVYRIMLGPS